jgi:tripartite-type tricarboxylate transporter receptor subunit TctC
MAVWYGAFGPAGMRKDVVARLNGEINRILLLPDVKSRMDELAVEIARASPDELGEMTRRDADKWGRVIRELGITPQ